ETSPSSLSMSGPPPVMIRIPRNGTRRKASSGRRDRRPVAAHHERDEFPQRFARRDQQDPYVECAAGGDFDEETLPGRQSAELLADGGHGKRHCRTRGKAGRDRSDEL